MTKPQKIEGGWERAFEKRFVDDAIGGWADVCYEDVVDFISDLLASERQRCVEFLRDKIEDEVIGIFNGNRLSAKEQRSRLDKVLEQLK